MDQNTVIKKIKQALRDKHLRRKDVSSSSVSQSTASTTSSTIANSSITSSPPILIATINYGSATAALEEESKQIEEYMNDSTQAPHFYVPMPPLPLATTTPTVQLQQDSPSRDFSSIHHNNPYGYHHDSLSSGKYDDYQEVARQGSDLLSMSLRSCDMQLLRESLRSVEMRDSLRSIDMDIDDSLFE